MVNCLPSPSRLRHSASALSIVVFRRSGIARLGRFCLQHVLISAAHPYCPIPHAALSKLSNPGPCLFPECFSAFYLSLVCTLCVCVCSMLRTTLLCATCASCRALFPCPVRSLGVYSGDLFPRPVCSVLRALSKHPVCCISEQSGPTSVMIV